MIRTVNGETSINTLPAHTEVYPNEIICGVIDTVTKVDPVTVSANLYLGVSLNHGENEDDGVNFIEATPDTLIEITCVNSNTGLPAKPILYKPYGITITARGNHQLDTYNTTYLVLIPIRVRTASDGTIVATCRFVQGAYNQATLLSVV